MLIYKGYRQCGKTVHCIKKAYETRAVIVTSSSYMGSYVIRLSRDLNMPVEVMSIGDFIYHCQHRTMRNKRIIIDDLECVLQTMFGDGIEFITTSMDVVNIPEWENIHNKIRSIFRRLKLKWKD